MTWYQKLSAVFKKPFVVFLLLIPFWPIPTWPIAIILMWENKIWTLWIRVIVTAFFSFIVLDKLVHFDYSQLETPSTTQGIHDSVAESEPVAEPDPVAPKE